MANETERYVLEMRLEDGQFKQKANETVGLLQKLKNALNFSGSENSLDKISKSAAKTDLSPLAKSIESVKVGFSNLEMIAIGALQRIGERAIDAGIQLAKNLTIGPIADGFNEYELKLNSVQTIMNATGADLSTVSAYLQDLNTYADQTIYSFSDMTSAIGKFTNAGVDLDLAVKAIKGVSNATAYAGLGADAASSAFYNFAQALSTGYLGMADYRSVGMTFPIVNKRFQQELVNTALEMGTLIDNGNEYVTVTGNASGSTVTLAKDLSRFQYSLQGQWVTSDVLVKTLEKYSDETTELGRAATDSATKVKTFTQLMSTIKESIGSGWSETFEIVIGDFEQARERWTAVSNELGEIFDKQAKIRNKTLKDALDVPQEQLKKLASVDKSWDTIAKRVEAAGVPVEKFWKRCVKVGEAMGLLTDPIDTFEKFKESLTSGWLGVDVIAKVIDSFITPTEEYAETTEVAGKSLEEFKTVVDQVVWGEWGRGEARFKALAEAGWDYAKVQAAVNAYFYQGARSAEAYAEASGFVAGSQSEVQSSAEGDAEALNELKDAYSGMDGPITDMANAQNELLSGSQLLFGGIKQGWNGLKGVFTAISKGWKMAFPPVTSQQIYNILKSFNELMTSFSKWVGNYQEDEDNPLSNTVKRITYTFAGLGSVVGLAIDTVTAFGRFLNKTFGGDVVKAINSLLRFTGNLGKLLKNMRSWATKNNVIEKSFDKLYAKLKAGYEVISTFIKSFNDVPEIANAMNSLKTILKTFIDSILGLFPSASGEVSNLWEALKTLWRDKDFGKFVEVLNSFVKAIGSDFKMAWDSLKSFFPNITNGINEFGNSVDGLDMTSLPAWAKVIFSTITTILGPGATLFSSIVDLIVSSLNGTQLTMQSFMLVLARFAAYAVDNIGAIVFAFALFKGGSVISEFAKTLYVIARGLTEPVDTICEAFNNLSRGVKGLRNVFNAFAVVEAAGAIALLAYTAVELGKVPADQMWNGVKAVAMLGAVIVALLFVVGLLTGAGGDRIKINVGATTITSGNTTNNLGNSAPAIKKTKNGMLQVLELAAAVFLVAQAFMKIVNIVNTTSLGKLILSLGIMMGVIVVMTACVKSLNKSGAGLNGNGIWQFIAMALLLKVVVGVFQDLYKLTSDESFDPNALTNAAWGLVYCVAALMVLMLTMERAKVSKGVGSSLLAMAVSMKILMWVLNDLIDIQEKVGSPQGLYDLVTNLVVIAGVLGLLMYGLSTMGENAKQAGVGLLATSAAIWVLVQVIVQVSSMELGTIVKGGLVVTALGGLLILLLWLFGKVDDSKGMSWKQVGLIFSLAGAMVILSGAVILLGMIDTGKLIQGTLALSTIMAFFALLVAATSKASKDVKPSFFVGLIALVASLVAAIVIIGMMDPDKVLIGVLAMTEMMTFLGILMMCVKAMGDVKVGPIIALGVIILALAGSVFLLGQLDEKKVAMGTAAMMAMMATMSVMSIAVSYAIGMANLSGKNGLIALALMCALILSMSAAVALLCLVPNADLAISIAVALGILMASLGVAMIGVAKLGALDANGIKTGIIGMISILGTVVALIAILTIINEAFDGVVVKGVEKTFDVLNVLGQAIGQFFGGAISAILSSLDLELIGGQLNTLGESLSSFGETMSGFGEGAVDGVNALVKMVLALAAADFIGAITKFIGGDTTSLADFGAQLVPFGVALGAYSAAVAFVDAEKVKASAEAGGYLSDLANNLPTTGGWKATILGETTTLDTFATSIGKYAEGLVGVCGTLGSGPFDAELIQQAATAGGYLNELQKNLPATNGWKQKILGEPTTLDTFGAGLLSFATGIVDFTKKVDEVKDYSPMSKATSAAMQLVLLSNVLPDETGWIDKIFGGGKMDLATFGKNLEDFGTALVGYAGSVEGLTDAENLKNVLVVVTDLLKMLNNPLNDLSKVGDLKDAAEDIKDFGEDFKAYYEKVSGVDTLQLSRVTTSFGRLLQVITNTDESFSTKVTGIQTLLSELSADGLEDFCLTFEGSGERVSTAVGTFIDAIIAALDANTVNYKESALDGLTEYLGVFINATEASKTSANVVLTALLNTLNDGHSEFRFQGQEMIRGFTNGIYSKLNDLFECGSVIVQQAIFGMGDHYNDTWVKGNNFAVGFSNGITENAHYSYDAAWQMGRDAVIGLQQAINSHSPSKETQKLGNYAGMGFVDALYSWASKSEEAGGELGQASLDSLNAVIHNIPKMLDTVMNDGFVIRPVVDLTSAQASAEALSSMFNRSIGVSAGFATTANASVDRVRVASVVNPTTAVEGESTASNNKTEINNVFNITSNDPDEVANRVSYVLQRQVERRQSAWAQSSGTGSPRTRSGS